MYICDIAMYFEMLWYKLSSYCEYQEWCLSPNVTKADMFMPITYH